jgi:hypothetical protein
MFKEPKKYTDNDHFFFEADNELIKVCNAPKDKQGVFKVIELKNGKINLVFIGSTNSADTQSNVGGLYHEIVNGLHFDNNPRKIGWYYQLIKDKVDAIDVYWYVTENPKNDLTDLLKQHVDQYGKLPKWNK